MNKSKIDNIGNMLWVLGLVSLAVIVVHKWFSTDENMLMFLYFITVIIFQMSITCYIKGK